MTCKEVLDLFYYVTWTLDIHVPEALRTLAVAISQAIAIPSQAIAIPSQLFEESDSLYTSPLQVKTESHTSAALAA